MRIEQLTFTRFIAAAAIVVFHYGQNIFPFSTPFLQPLFDRAYLGVSYFFILSGFVMVIAYQKENTIKSVDFFRSRIARIYPIYLLALLLIVISNILDGQVLNKKAFGLSVIGLQSWIPPYPLKLNAPGWSISVEFLFYALFPPLYNLFYTKLRIRTLAISILSVWVLSQLALHFLPYLPLDIFQKLPATTRHDLLHYHPLLHLSEFLIGNLAGLVFIPIANKRKNYDVLILLTLAILFTVILLPTPFNFHNGLLAVLYVPIIILLCLNTGRITSFFNTKQLVFLGEISFGMYILQAPVFSWSDRLTEVVGLQDASTTFYFSFILLILLSCLSYIYIETPLRKRIKTISIFGRRKERVTV